MKTKSALIIIVVLIASFLGGCATTQRRQISQYSAEKEIKKGVTTKQEILEIFGPPNITSTMIDPSLWANTPISKEIKLKIKEYWVYSKVNMDMFGGTIGFLFGATTSSKTVMLQIFFDEEDKVVDYTVTTMQF